MANLHNFSQKYTPSAAAAGLFSALFFVSAIVTLIEILYFFNSIHKTFIRKIETRSNGLDANVATITLHKSHKKNLFGITYKYYMIVIACLTEGVGYALRATLTKANSNLTNIYIAQSVLLLIGPIFEFIIVLFLFQKLVRTLGYQHLLPFSPQRFRLIIVCCNILGSILQTIGISRISHNNNYDKSLHLVIAGLAIQIACYAVLALTILRVTISMKSDSHPTIRAPWKLCFFLLLACESMVLIRTIVRLVEYIQGIGGFISRHEVFLYVFDALPVFLGMVCFCSTILIRVPLQIESEAFISREFETINTKEDEF